MTRAEVLLLGLSDEPTPCREQHSKEAACSSRSYALHIARLWSALLLQQLLGQLILKLAGDQCSSPPHCLTVPDRQWVCCCP